MNRSLFDRKEKIVRDKRKVVFGQLEQVSQYDCSVGQSGDGERGVELGFVEFYVVRNCGLCFGDMVCYCQSEAEDVGIRFVFEKDNVGSRKQLEIGVWSLGEMCQQRRELIGGCESFGRV